MRVVQVLRQRLSALAGGTEARWELEGIAWSISDCPVQVSLVSKCPGVDIRQTPLMGSRDENLWNSLSQILSTSESSGGWGVFPKPQLFSPSSSFFF